MIIIGIITVPKTNKKIHKRYFRPASIIKKIDKYIVAELSVSAKQIGYLSEKRLNKILKKAEKLLKSDGATHIILSQECKAALVNTNIAERFNITKSTKIPQHKILEAFCYSITKINDFKRNSALLICDRSLTFVDYEILEKICTSVKYITLRTKMAEKAAGISEKLFDEYGILINVMGDNSDNKFYYVIDFDECIVRAGDFIIDGAEFSSGLIDYSIDPLEEAACFGTENELPVKNWLSGGNRLKIS